MSLSVSVGLLKKYFLVAELLPMTILETPEIRANSAICRDTSSPYTVSMFAPSCCARRAFSRRRFLSFSFREEKSEVSTNRAVKAARKALAILAAVRMIRPLEGAGTDRLKCARPCDSLFGFWNAHPLSRDSPGQRIALGQFREVR